MKILFLDIDGVLNSQKWHEQRVMEGLKAQPTCDIDPSAIEQLNKIVYAHSNLKVVISSTWKHHVKGNHSWNMMFDLLGCKANVIDTTPNLQTYRGTEILSWLIQRSKNEEKIDSFVILDDDDDMEMLTDRLVLCSTNDGLTSEKANEVIQKLREPVNLTISLGEKTWPIL
jgi:hypothetical protein